MAMLCDGSRGFDPGKKINGKSSGSTADTYGSILGITVYEVGLRVRNNLISVSLEPSGTPPCSQLPHIAVNWLDD